MPQKSITEHFESLKSSRAGLSQSEARKRLKIYGPNLIEEPKQRLLIKILKYFWGPIPWMIEVAALLSFAVHHIPDLIFIGVLLIFNAALAFWQEYQAENAIDALKKHLAIKSRVLRDREWVETQAVDLVPGDIIRVRLGDCIPADAITFEGDYLLVDQSTLTGESLPVTKKAGDQIYMGSIAQKGEMVALVNATGKSTYFGKTATLVATAKSVSHFQQAVMQIGRFLIFVCAGLVVLLVAIQLLRQASLLHMLQFALILTIASIPVALPAVLSVTMAVGALVLSKRKAIVSKLETIEEMAGIDILCCDKTGTLTQNQLVVGSPLPFEGAQEKELLVAAALASKAEDLDLIDLAVLKAAKGVKLKGYMQLKYTPFDPVAKRTEAQYKGPGGKVLTVTKGAPQVVVELCALKGAHRTSVLHDIEACAAKGYRTLGVAKREKGGAWHFLGLIPLFDPLRKDSLSTIHKAIEHGIQIKIITGDHLAIACETAHQLGIGTEICDAHKLGYKEGKPLKAAMTKLVEKADGFAQVFPENKFSIVKALQKRGHIVGMTGDGVNDAPALKQANLGIAVSGATDAARAAASLVLMAPGLGVIIKAIEEARHIFERMNTYAIYRIAETIRIMFFVVLAMLVYNFYPITATMIIMLALLNDIPIMTIAYDNTLLPKNPVRWQMQKVIVLAAALGLVGVCSSFLLMVLAQSVFHLPHAELQSVIFLKLSVAGHLTLFVVRSRRSFFARPFPAPILFFAILCTQIVATVIVVEGVFVTPIPLSYVGWIWLYALAGMLVSDGIKVLLLRTLYTNYFKNREYAKEAP